MTAEAARVQQLPLVVAISSLLFQRVTPRTDFKVCAGSPKMNIVRSFGGIGRHERFFATHTRASRDDARAMREER
jgi:hypothetical protein